VPSRQDQLHSYQYSLQRVVSALVTHDPDPHRSPLRRAGTTALVSVVIAALAVGGAAIYGLLTGHSTVQLRDESVVFLEKGSGARYVYLRSDDRLHPVLNYTSGLLIANAQAPKLVSTSRERLPRCRWVTRSASRGRPTRCRWEGTCGPRTGRSARRSHRTTRPAHR
jgi:hypothetical protein